MSCSWSKYGVEEVEEKEESTREERLSRICHVPLCQTTTHNFIASAHIGVARTAPFPRVQQQQSKLPRFMVLDNLLCPIFPMFFECSK